MIVNGFLGYYSKIPKEFNGMLKLKLNLYFKLFISYLNCYKPHIDKLTDIEEPAKCAVPVRNIRKCEPIGPLKFEVDFDKSQKLYKKMITTETAPYEVDNTKKLLKSSI